MAGVGEKTAARLIDRYGGLDAIVAAMDDPEAGFAPGLRAKLAAAAPTTWRWRRRWCGSPATIDLPPLDTDAADRARDADRLIELAGRWGVAERGAPPGRRGQAP